VLSLVKEIKKCISLKMVAVVITAAVIVLMLGTVSYFQKEVVINLDGNQIVVRTMKSTVKEVLKQNGIRLGKYDYVSVPIDTKLQSKKNNIINIKSAVPVYVSADGQEIELMTSKETVKEALQGEPINLSHSDKIQGANPDDRIVKGMRLKVVRVTRKLVSQNEVIPCEVVKKDNNSMDMGQYRIVNEGKDGVREKTYMVEYQDGKEVKRLLVDHKVVVNPEDKVVEHGTIPIYTTSRGENFRYKKVMEMRATAYTASYEDTGKTPDHPEFGITYTGMRVKKGVVAVDPKVIPLGTRLYVEGIGNVPDYGYAIAADIGSAVKGDIIDLYMDDSTAVKRWGVKKVKVYILYD
jgi:uncharacterized protein YabE (DUF348 family)